MPQRPCVRAAVLVVLAACALSAAKPPAFERALPASTLLHVTVRSVPQLLKEMKRAGLDDMLKDPAVKAFIDAPLQQFTEMVEGQMGLTTGEFVKVLNGEFSVSLVNLSPRPGKQAPQPHILLLIDVGKMGNVLLELIGKLEAKAKEENENAFQRIEDEHAGTRIVGLLPPPDKDGDPPPPEEGFYYAVSGDVFVAGTPVEAVKRTISDLSTPPGESLATKSSYDEMRQRIGPKSQAFVFVDIADIMTAISKSLPQDAAQTINVLGLDAMKWLGAGGRYVDAFHANRVFLKTTGEQRGILAMVTPVPGKLHSPERIPGDANLFWSVRTDLTRTWETARQILRTLKPGADAKYEEAMDGVSKQLGQPFDVGRNVISVFGPRIGMYQTATAGDESAPMRTVVLMDVKSKTDFENLWSLIGRLNPMVVNMFKQEEYLGHTLNVFSMTPPGQQPPPGAKSVTFCVLEDQVIISDYREGVQRHLRSLRESKQALSTAKGYRVTSARLPARARGMVAYIDQGPRVKTQIKQFMESQFILAGMLSKAVEKAPPLLRPILQAIDLSKLPSGGSLEPYTTVSSVCIVPQDDGILLSGTGIPTRDLKKQPD